MKSDECIFLIDFAMREGVSEKAEVEVLKEAKGTKSNLCSF